MFFSYSAQRMQSLTKTAFITKMNNKKGLLLTSQPKWNPIQKSFLYLMRIKGNILLWRAGTWLNCYCANRNKTFFPEKEVGWGFCTIWQCSSSYCQSNTANHPEQKSEKILIMFGYETMCRYGKTLRDFMTREILLEKHVRMSVPSWPSSKIH